MEAAVLQDVQAVVLVEADVQAAVLAEADALADSAEVVTNIS